MQDGSLTIERSALRISGQIGDSAFFAFASNSSHPRSSALIRGRCFLFVDRRSVVLQISFGSRFKLQKSPVKTGLVAFVVD